MAILVSEGPFRSFDNAVLYARQWRPEGNLRAAMVVVHGYGHHSGSFQELGERLAADGIAVHAYDQRGFGKAEGGRGNVVSFTTALRDLDAFLTHVAEDLDDTPLFLFGHSLGGLILATYAVVRQPIVQGLVFSSPMLKIPDRVSPWLLKASGIISTVLPFLPVEKVDVSAISRDPAVIQRAWEDPLCYYGPVNARSGDEIVRAIRFVQPQFPLINVPFLVMHGSADRLTDPEGSRQLFEQAAVSDKTLGWYEGGYHELFNDVEKERFYSELTEWVGARSAAGDAAEKNSGVDA